jgi:hypothetical protein
MRPLAAQSLPSLGGHQARSAAMESRAELGWHVPEERATLALFFTKSFAYRPFATWNRRGERPDGGDAGLAVSGDEPRRCLTRPVPKASLIVVVRGQFLPIH